MAANWDMVYQVLADWKQKELAMAGVKGFLRAEEIDWAVETA